MAEKDKVIKSGQLTLPRLLFLLVACGVIVATVALGGVWLSVGYWLLTLALIGLLYLVVTDYGIKLDNIDLVNQPSQAALESAPATNAVSAAPSEARVKRKPARPVKRRR